MCCAASPQIFTVATLQLARQSDLSFLLHPARGQRSESSFRFHRFDGLSLGRESLEAAKTIHFADVVEDLATCGSHVGQGPLERLWVAISDIEKLGRNQDPICCSAKADG
jgi:hypothetical protein